METFREIWQLGGDVFDSFKPRYRTALIAIIKATGVNNGWTVLNYIRGCEPDLFTFELYRYLVPYELPEVQRQRINQLLENGFIEAVEPDVYQLTHSGRKAINRIFTIAHREIGKIQSIPFHDMKRLANLLEYVVVNALNAPEPVNKCGLTLSRWSDIGSTGPASTRIEQYLTDLKRFRADCHRASWSHYGVSGIAWEAFTTLWRGEATTPEGIAEVLHYRSVSVDDYLDGIHALIDRGWVEAGQTPDTFQPSPKGMAVRGESQRVTDHLFFAPWQTALSDAELAELDQLLRAVVDTMREPVH